MYIDIAMHMTMNITILVLTMTMYMHIVMTMNIYITEDNRINLKNLNGSMSGLVNELLRDYFNKQPTATKVYPASRTRAVTATDLRAEDLPSLAELEQKDLEDPYPELVWDTATQRVYDKTTGEEAEADPSLVKELKRLGKTV